MILLSGALRLLRVAESVVGGRGAAAAPEHRTITVLGSRDAIKAGRCAANPSRFNVFRQAENMTKQEIDRLNAQSLNTAIRRGDDIWLRTNPEKHAARLFDEFDESAFWNSNYIHVELPMLEQYESIVPIIRYR